MKKIFSYAVLLLAGTFAMTSCEKDMDSNPVLLQPTEFVLNEPALGATVNLETATELNTLTWSQPVFASMNAPVVVNYTVELATSEDFSNKFQYGETLTTCSVDLIPSNVNMAMQLAYEWAGAEDVPSSTDLYARVVAEVKNAGLEAVSSITSNVVKMSVAPYFKVLTAADPVVWFLIGSDICDGSWGSDIPGNVVPMEPIAGEEYDMVTGTGLVHWIGYLGGNGFKLRGDMTDGWATQWGQGGSFGDYVKNDGGSGNITVPSAGVYEVKLDTKNDKLEVVEYTGTVKTFAGMAISGSFNGWSDDAMTPVHSVAGADNHDWCITYSFAKGDEVKIKEAGSWDFNRGGALNSREDGGFDCFGVGNGDNLVVTEDGKYLILFNDITGYIRFIKQ